ncbi:MAG: hypothetical protein RMJ37_02125 [Spirochaetia bacterium]|nr:hypothetical protein [Spirochaetota bacterium]MCX8097108.1 hypothetical protein [Spirochaetota bacterium]MDW8112122.1 hypothetical protein [Spirochaetia bacterium]
MDFILFTLVIILFFLVIFLYARLKDEIKNVKGKGIVEEIKKEIEGLIVEFNKVSNRKIIVMDEKIKELDNLIKTADDRILKLDNITRNYLEAIKRYEIMKKELQNQLTIQETSPHTDTNNPYQTTKTPLQEKPQKHSRKTKTESSIPLINTNQNIQQVYHQNQYEEAHIQTKPERELLNDIQGMKDSKLEIIKEIENINIEELEVSARAELLRKLLTINFDEDKLVEMGFSPSEIKIAKVVMSSKK